MTAKNFIPLFIIGGLLSFIILWNVLKTPPKLVNTTPYVLKPGTNGLLSFTAYADSTLTVSYAYNGDTLTQEFIDRKEFTKIIYMLYPGREVEAVQQLEVDHSKIKNINY